ncbi:hypothetical protein [Riemerella columbina]|uniref:hypothetical protein n=1 Tax=Riemerella columbina TaxID=103810 RepID=UPI00267084C3|nr:hypothetical protein [Riemerella columbina]WKS96039.1 hypothetical protein NYR17_04715 [Riemerella columbina]
MNCYNHPETISVATCVDCGRGLCTDCSQLYTIPICTHCNAKRISQEKRDILKDFAWMIAVALMLAFIFRAITERPSPEGPVSSINPFFAFYMGLSYYNGWKFLTRFTSKYFLSMSIFGWLMYFVLKFTLGGIVGLFVTPFVIIRKIIRWVTLSRIAT